MKIHIKTAADDGYQELAKGLSDLGVTDSGMTKELKWVQKIRPITEFLGYDKVWVNLVWNRGTIFGGGCSLKEEVRFSKEDSIDTIEAMFRDMVKKYIGIASKLETNKELQQGLDDYAAAVEELKSLTQAVEDAKQNLVVLTKNLLK